MTEIKFRGRKKDSKIWFYGGYAAGSYDMSHNRKTYKHYIITDAMAIIEVDLETVGQFVGITDEKGVEIYGGDIVDAGTDGRFPSERCIVKFGDHEAQTYDGEVACLGWFVERIDGVANLIMPTSPLNVYLEVIGNEHDNPELMKRTKK